MPAHPRALPAVAAAAVLAGAVGVAHETITALGTSQIYFGLPFGRLGSNRYCGPVQRVIRAPRGEHGRRGRIISRRTVIRCSRPPFVGVSISVTYDATPVPPAPPA